jgi:ferredoxin/coenzyme F420-reducing hydrogenase delta subunit
MRLARFLLRRSLQPAEEILDRFFGPAWNPLFNLGALGFFYYWIVAVSGIYIYIFFDTGTTEAFDSVKSLTYDQWYLGGVMRSLHRYASDGLVLMMGVHILREFSLGRYRGRRWFTWFTGVPILWLVIVSGITGYWLVWDKLAQYVAIATSELLDTLPVFGEPIARNFLTPLSLDDRFFTLMMFMHIAVPLILLFILWIHLQRVSRPRMNPPRGLAVGTFVMLLVLAFVHPATSQAPADLGAVPASVGLDWFYLFGYPMIDAWPGWFVWTFAGTLTLILAVLPWMPPMRRAPAAVVNLESCNGCRRCADDCPYNAITMEPRSDGLAFDQEAVVHPSLCVACGICGGACPTATPFRRRSDLIPGIELPQRSLKALREEVQGAACGLAGDRRILVFGCEHGVSIGDLDQPNIGKITLPCIGALPPSFIDYVLSRNLADGIFLAGCGQGECYNRFGILWTTQRLARQRDPYLRERVPRERIGTCWAASNEVRVLARAVKAFAEGLTPPPRRSGSREPEPSPKEWARTDA